MNIFDIDTNSYFYNYINSIDDNKICFLVPNHITILNFILSLYIIYAVYKKSHNIPTFLVLIFIRSILDCLDGAVARKCNKTSELGKYLDVLSDTITFILLMLLLYFKPNYPWIKDIIPLIILIIIYVACNCLYNEYEFFKDNKFGKLYYKNMIIVNVIMFRFLLKLIK